MRNCLVTSPNRTRHIGPLLLLVALIMIALPACSRGPEPACCVCTCRNAGARPCAEIRLKAAAGVYCQGLCENACMSQGCLMDSTAVVGSGACPGKPASRP
jgi:hypothetical protein